MKLSWQISLLVLFVAIFISSGNYFLTQYQAKSLYLDSEKMLADTVFHSISEALVQDVMSGNSLKVTSLLRKIQVKKNPIEFMYVTNGGHDDIFAHSFENNMPQYLINQGEVHHGVRLNHNSMVLSKKYQTDNGLIYEYSEPLMPGLDLILHIGINQTEINEKFIENSRYLLELSMIMMLIVLGISYVWGKIIFTPLREFINKLKQYGQDEIMTFDDQNIRTFEVKQLSVEFKRVILDREKALATLNEKENNLAITLDSIGDAVITTDETGIVTRMNPVAEKLTGWSFEEAKGKLLKSIFHIVNETTRETIENPVDKVLSTGTVVYLSNHTTLISRDGEEYQISDSAAPIRTGDNKILGMVLVFNDVTESYNLRKKANLVQQTLIYKEKEQREILDSMLDAVITIDHVGTILNFNRTAENLFGYNVAEVIGKNIKMLMPGSVSAKHDNYLKTYMQGGESHIIGVGREVVGLRKNKKTFPFLLSIAELPDDGKNERRFLGTCKDLTQIKQQEELLNRSQKMEALGHLTGGIAHDYNNMLGVILGYSELLMNMLHDQPKLEGYAQQIHRAGVRGERLTKKMLSFSRKSISTASKVDINEILMSERNLIEKTLTPRIKLVLNLEKNLWSSLLDENDLEDAVINLSINSMHAMEDNESGSFFTISTCNQVLNVIDANILGVSAGEYIKVCFSDTGHGMSNEIKDKIFDPFYSTKGEKGTGLGLSQVFGFVKRSSGVINVYSEIGHGSQFVLYFPRFNKSENDKQKVIKGETENLRGKENILVVDDEEAIRDLCSELLRIQGYNVYCADSVKQALNVLKNEQIDLVLSDVIMPDVDGYQLAAMLQKQYPQIKIQLASGFTDERHKYLVDECLRMNMLQKPYQAQSLFKNIRQLLDDKKSTSNSNPSDSLSMERIKSIKIGLNDLDEDHNILISLLNKSIEIVNGKNDISTMGVIFDELIEYTQYHFPREVEIMKTCQYPQLENHCKVHNLLVSELQLRKTELTKDTLTLDSLRSFINGWLEHMMEMDKAVAVYCNNKDKIISKNHSD